jgi:hypothetical protein
MNNNNKKKRLKFCQATASLLLPPNISALLFCPLDIHWSSCVALTSTYAHVFLRSRGKMTSSTGLTVRMHWWAVADSEMQSQYTGTRFSGNQK